MIAVAVRDDSTPPPAAAMEFRVLGGFEVVADGRSVTPSAPKLRQALALLVVEHNRTVPVPHLIDELWGPAPPRQATKTVHTFLYELRRGMPPLAGTGQVLVTMPNGYLAAVPPASLDVTEFETLVRAGSEALTTGDPETARDRLLRALALWRGPALANVTVGAWLEAVAAGLAESRLRALELRVEADLQLHRHGELIAELRALAARYPFHEGIHEKLMLALYRSGRRTEALEAYRSLRCRLTDELGLDPGARVQRLHELMLRGDPVLEPPARQRVHPVLTAASGPAEVASTGKAPPGELPPTQLPPGIADFTGRQSLVRTVTSLLAAQHGRTTPPVVSLTGMPGVGKTTTAIHIGRTIAADYPDGQIYVPLGRSAGTRQGPSQPLTYILRSLGHNAPAAGDPEYRVAAYRTWTADRRLLVVLDDAGSAAEVEPLLPAGPGCAAIVTSRSPLYGLPSARPFQVAVMAVDEGVSLLARILGPERVYHQHDAAKEIVALVGGLPLAIRSVGQRLATAPERPLAEFARQLAHARAANRLSEVACPDTNLHARLAACYDRLPGADRSAFRLLALLREADFTADEAANVFRTDPASAELTLLRLTDDQLVQLAAGSSAGGTRYRLHELVRPYTLECIAAGGSTV